MACDLGEAGEEYRVTCLGQQGYCRGMSCDL